MAVAHRLRRSIHLNFHGPAETVARMYRHCVHALCVDRMSRSAAPSRDGASRSYLGVMAANGMTARLHCLTARPEFARPYKGRPSPMAGVRRTGEWLRTLYLIY